MPAPLAPLSLQNPGHRGLNTQDTTWVSNQGWASTLLNSTFDTADRVQARKGWEKLTTSSSFGAFDLKQVYCYENGSNTVVISAGNDKILSGTTTLTDRTGTAPASNNNWQFQTWSDGTNRKIVAWQEGETPIVSTVTGATPGNFAPISASTGTIPSGNCCLAAYGRIWASDTDGLTVKYSGLLNETQWASGGAGSINTAEYWPRGLDFITAIAAWENRLVVFGRRNILIYDNPADIGNFPLLSNTVEGVGCVARDSVQVVGSDILFLSETGLRSLQRSIETDKNPMQEIGVQVRDVLVPYISGNESNIRSCYNQGEGFYLLVIPASSEHVCFMYDMKALKNRDLLGRSILDLENIRVSIWKGWEASGVAYGRDGVMYGSFRDSTDSNEGVIGKYNQYLDNTSTYQWMYESPWVDMSQDTAGAEDRGQLGGTGWGAFLKIPKSIKYTLLGGVGYQMVSTWAYDYSDSSYSQVYVVPGEDNETSEYNVSEYGIAEWGFSESSTVNQTSLELYEDGQVIKVGLGATINGNPLALQRIDIFVKRGRLQR